MSEKNNEKPYSLRLKDFFDNGGLVDASRPPQLHEPFYSRYVAKVIHNTGIDIGDSVTITTLKHDITGIVVGLFNHYHIRIYTSADDGSIVQVPLHDIVNIELLEKAREDFNVYTLNPDYISEQALAEEHDQWLKCQEEHSYTNKKLTPIHQLEEFKKAYPGIPVDKSIILCLSMNLFWPYEDAKIQADISVISKAGHRIYAVPNASIEYVYDSNKNWYRACTKGLRHVLIPFLAEKELSQIRYVACLWTITTKDETIRILSMNYPSFKPHPLNYRIYNVCMYHGCFRTYVESLHDKAQQLENLYTDYDELLCFEDDDMIMIKSEHISEDGELKKTFNNQYMDIMNILSDNTNVPFIGDSTEIFICNESVMANHMFCGYPDYSKKRKYPHLPWLNSKDKNTEENDESSGNTQ